MSGGETASSDDPCATRKDWLIPLLTVAAGIVVANVFYIQPILPTLARVFPADATSIAVLPLSTQAGYALGLLTITPIGDLVDRRRVLNVLLALLVLSLVAASLSPSFMVLAIASFFIGLFSTAVQQMVPFAAELAAPGKAARAVGLVMSGILTGILLARVVGGFLTQWFGWRWLFGFAAAVAITFACVLAAYLPSTKPTSDGNYPSLLTSVWQVARERGLLQRASLIGGLLFGAFSAFWTTVALFTAQPPYQFGATAVGALGLLGATGIVAAPISGRLTDKGHERAIIVAGAMAAAVSFVVLWFANAGFSMLLLGIVLLDLGVQAAHVANQSRVFASAPAMRSRLNTVYMTAYYGGGALGTATASLAWSIRGWHGVCAVGFALAIGAAFSELMTRRIS